jgi:hypothetical protein
MSFRPKRASRKPIVFLLLLLLVGGCGSPAYWEAVGEGMSGSNAGASSSSGGQKQEVCAKYQTDSGWSQGYTVMATIINGSDLNAETGSYSYEPYATYAVIFWDQGEASVLNLQYYSGEITAYETSATDQRGRSWKVSTPSVCY